MTSAAMLDRIGRSAVAPYADRIGPGEEALERYRRDPFAHLDDGHVRILDLETQEETLLDPWPHQREIVAAWVELDELLAHGRLRYRNVHEEKSRQMGVSWILAWVDLWALMYHDASGLVLSLNFREVDDGGSGSTIDSDFGRIRFMHERMPEEYRAPLVFTYGLIRHSGESNSFLTAEGAGPDPGRGGRYRRVRIEEAARIAFDRSAHSALTRACPVGRFYNSTPNGEGNTYFRLREVRPRNYSFLRHHWSKHPFYSVGLHVAGTDPAKCELCAGNVAKAKWSADDPSCHRYPGRLASPWYDEAILDLTDEEVARELDIDYAGSLTARVFSEFDEDRHVVDAGIPYESAFPIELCFDYGVACTAVCILQDAPSEVRMIGDLEVTEDAHPEKVVDLLLERLAELGVPSRELIREQTIEWRCVGDPAGEGREQSTGRPLASFYRQLGFAISSRRWPTPSPSIVATKRLLLGRPKRLLVSGPDCRAFVRHIKNHRWETDRTGAVKMPPRLREDEHKHICDAFRYWVAFKFPPSSVEEELAEATANLSRPRRGSAQEIAERMIRESEEARRRPLSNIRPGMKF